jgi:HEAT repeat protein
MLDQTLNKIADPQQTLTHKTLRTLSGLDRASVAALAPAWPKLPTERRRAVVRALVEMAEDDPELDFVDVFRIMLDDADAEVRAAAISGLFETTDETFVDPLIKMLSSDLSAEVRANVAELLGQFAMLAAEERLHNGRPKRLKAALLACFHNNTDPLNTDAVRRNALESVAFFGDDERVVVAIRDAFTAGTSVLRAAALSAMGNTFDPTWEPIIMRELESQEPEMRFEAARAAGNLWIEKATPRLVAMTSDPDQEVQLMAIWALGEIGGLQAKATLTQLLESHDESVRDAAEEALDELRFNEDPLDASGLFDAGSRGKKKDN